MVRGLSRRGRSFVGLIFVGLAILVAGVVLRIVEIRHGGPPLPQPRLKTLSSFSLGDRGRRGFLSRWNESGTADFSLARSILSLVSTSIVEPDSTT